MPRSSSHPRPARRPAAPPLCRPTGLLAYEVRSRSWPAAWHRCDLALDECSCVGFAYAGHCWHLDLCWAAQERLEALARGRLERAA